MVQEQSLNKPTVVLLDDSYSAKIDDESKRRIIRSHYRAIENRISEHKDELAKASSEKFLAILNEVDNIHQHVTKPREQVSDAETLLGLVNTFTSAVKSSSNGGVTPAEFVSCLISQFTKKRRQGVARDATDILWHDIGSSVSPFLREAPRCMTMCGPMDTEIKMRKTYTRVKRTKPVGNARPEEIEKANEAETDTDRNMMVMYGILRKKYKNNVKVQLENLILNKNSFAQTVENLFALSFLVHRGSAAISVDEDGSHVVVPANAPTNEQIVKGEAKVHQFIFRFDFHDWKLMKDHVLDGEELMPPRNVNTTSCYSQAKSNACHGQDKAALNNDDVNVPQAIPIKSPILGQAKAVSNDENVNIPQAIPIKSPSHGQAKAVSNDENVNIPRAIPVYSPHHGRAKASSNDENVNIPQAIPVNSPYRDVNIPQATLINSPSQGMAKAGSNHEHDNILEAIPVNSPHHGRAKTVKNDKLVYIHKAAPVKAPHRGRAKVRSNDEDINIPEAILINAPISSVVEAVPISYAFPRNHRRMVKSRSKSTDAGKVTVASLRNSNVKRKRNGQ